MIEPTFAEVFFCTRYLFGSEVWYSSDLHTRLYGPGTRVCFQGLTATIMSRYNGWARLQYDVSPHPVPLGYMTFTDVDLSIALSQRDIYLLEDELHGYESSQSVVGAGSTGGAGDGEESTVGRLGAASGVGTGQSW